MCHFLTTQQSCYLWRYLGEKWLIGKCIRPKKTIFVNFLSNFHISFMSIFTWIQIIKNVNMNEINLCYKKVIWLYIIGEIVGDMELLETGFFFQTVVLILYNTCLLWCFHSLPYSEEDIKAFRVKFRKLVPPGTNKLTLREILESWNDSLTPPYSNINATLHGDVTLDGLSAFL